MGRDRKGRVEEIWDSERDVCILGGGGKKLIGVKGNVDRKGKRAHGEGGRQDRLRRGGIW